jgi:anti-sigma factor ChrR (cupin superfamily)
MPSYSVDSPDFYDSITPESLRWTQVTARDAGLDVGSILMGEEDDAAAPMVLFLELPPGGVLRRHAHNCHRVEVLLRGSLDTGDGHVHQPGAVMVTDPDVFYGPHVAGPDGCLTVEIFGRANATTVFEDQAHQAQFDRVRAEGGR